MNPIYQPYSSLSAGQRKLLCFLAYTGRKTDEQILSLYRHVEELNAAQLNKLVKSLRVFYDTEFYSYRNEYQLHPIHIAPLMLYMLEEMPQWREHFDKFYKQYQEPKAMSLLSRMESCLAGKTVESRARGFMLKDAEILIPLASDARFLPMMTDFLMPTVLYRGRLSIR